MRTSLIEIQQIEDHLFGKDSTSLIGSSIVTDVDRAERVMWQKEAYAMVHRYGRNKLRDELEAIHNKLFTESPYARFRRQVMRLFR